MVRLQARLNANVTQFCRGDSENPKAKWEAQTSETVVGTLVNVLERLASLQKRGSYTMSSFKPGDTVQLNSGSPPMTVRVVEGDWVFCDWFEGTKKCEDKFLAATLDQVPSFASQKPRW